jgi:hypothetical protein
LPYLGDFATDRAHGPRRAERAGRRPPAVRTRRPRGR